MANLFFFAHIFLSLLFNTNNHGMLFTKYLLSINYNRNVKDLPDIVAERQKHVISLEGTITKTIAASYKHYAKKGDTELEDRPESRIPEKLRPRHRVSSFPIPLPFVGRKVDSIDYYHEEIQKLNEKINDAQRSPESYDQLSSAYIEFNQQIAAHMAAQCVTHSREMTMAPRYIQIAPNDIIWENMNVKSYERLGRRGVSFLITSAIIIFWAIPGIKKNHATVISQETE